jgi:phosphatidylserine/phosphatidylglycerophosphate/cardiolipin synthase-like enzyme
MRRGVLGGRVKLVSDALYLAELRALISHSTDRCLCSLFIVDVSPVRDPHLLVDSLLFELLAAVWRGVDVRLLIGGSRQTLAIAEASEAARARAHELGLPCRWLTSEPARGSHAKLVVCDDQVLLGSHNWSPGAFSGQIQDSALVVSPDLAAYLSATFERDWARGEDG